jgi:dihydroorotate dehydrogenase electron transfer subunit
MSTLRRGQFLATVRRNTPLCRDHFRLVLQLARFPATFPGQFIQIECRDPGNDPAADAIVEWTDRPPQPHGVELHNPLALLRRPFSLAGRRDLADGVELDIIHRVVGVGTQWLSELSAGDAVSILGPLGNRFTLPRDSGHAILVGGGVGIPPVLYLGESLRGRNAIAFVGATTRDLLPVTIRPDGSAEEFARHGIPSILTTDDGSLGFKGFVTEALERWLDAPQPTAPDPRTIYTCGPEPMMKKVAAIANARGIECQVAVERAMACGMGTCQSCCIRVKKPDPAQPPLAGSDWCYRLACTDGPVFRGSDLFW